jgi:hypothetical protein
MMTRNTAIAVPGPIEPFARETSVKQRRDKGNAQSHPLNETLGNLARRERLCP